VYESDASSFVGCEILTDQNHKQNYDRQGKIMVFKKSYKLQLDSNLSDIEIHTIELVCRISKNVGCQFCLICRLIYKVKS
jgi:hypothetical protein